MRVTKYEHAGMKVEKDGEALVIDPGGFTSPITDLSDVVGVVITHEHPDHWSPEHLARIVEAHPGVPIYAPESATKAITGFPIMIVKPGDRLDVGGFHLTFHDAPHNVIHKTLPLPDNVGVMIDDRFYFPGDSYGLPKHKKIEVLAAPIGAPWLKIGDAMDFVLDAKPRKAFGVHEGTLSAAGLDMHRARLRWATEENGGEFYDLDPGDILEF